MKQLTIRRCLKFRGAWLKAPNIHLTDSTYVQSAKMTCKIYVLTNKNHCMYVQSVFHTYTNNYMSHTQYLYHSLQIYAHKLLFRVDWLSTNFSMFLSAILTWERLTDLLRNLLWKVNKCSEILFSTQFRNKITKINSKLSKSEPFLQKWLICTPFNPIWQQKCTFHKNSSLFDSHQDFRLERDTANKHEEKAEMVISWFLNSLLIHFHLR